MQTEQACGGRGGYLRRRPWRCMRDDDDDESDEGGSVPKTTSIRKEQYGTNDSCARETNRRTFGFFSLADSSPGWSTASGCRHSSGCSGAYPAATSSCVRPASRSPSRTPARYVYSFGIGDGSMGTLTLNWRGIQLICNRVKAISYFWKFNLNGSRVGIRIIMSQFLSSRIEAE